MIRTLIRVAILLTCLGLLFRAQGEAAEQSVATPEALWQAAGEGDVTAVTSLLDQGLDVDAPTRYSATALTYAASKGHGAVVELLLQRGADPDPRDGFYHQTPLGWTLGRHNDIAMMLLRAGSDGVDGALRTALLAGNDALFDAAMSRGWLYTWQRTAALEIARRKKNADAVARLEAIETRPQATASVAESALASVIGRYEILGTERWIDLGWAPADPDRSDTPRTLILEGKDREPSRLRATGPRTFRAVDDNDLGVIVNGRSDAIESVMVSRLGRDLMFAPVDPPVSARRPIPESPAAHDGVTSARSASPHWPSFRGPNATGIADGATLPTHWDNATGENIRWKSAIPGLGHASPIVWGDQVFIATAVSSAGDSTLGTGLTGSFDTVDDRSEHTWSLLALDTKSGTVNWRRDVATATPQTTRHFKSTQANSTPVTDGERVVVVFPTAGMFCFDLDGKQLWRRDLGALDAGWFYDTSYQWGFAASPILYEDLVILQADIVGGAYIAAFDLETGDTVWRMGRDEIPTWATPAIWRGPTGDELVVNGTTIRGYDPRTGTELWHLAPNSEVIIAAPVITDTLIYVSAGYPPARPIYAIRPGSRGDLSASQATSAGAKTAEAIAWRHERGGAYMPTPLVYRGQYIIGHHDGRLASYDAMTGERLFRARFSKGGTFTGSPVAGDGKLYFVTEDGVVYVVASGPAYDEIARIDMDEVIMTTPAIAGGVLYLRTAGHVYAIANDANEAGRPNESPASALR